ncbi:MAG: RES domain-containing protein [Lysobacteraceae bacterium]
MIEVEVKCVCDQCVGEAYLAQLINSAKLTGSCDYCDREDVQVMTLDDLVERVDKVVEDYFYSGAPDPSSSVWTEPRGEPAEDVVASLLDAPKELVDDVLEGLGDRWFDWSIHEHKYGEDPHLVRRDSFSNLLSHEWWKMTRSLATESRFMNPEAKAVMEKVFGGLSALKTASGNGVIVKAGPGTRLQKVVRARVFQSEESLEEALSHPERFLGPPPPGTGRAGRMNAHGISAFYGSLEVETAIAEIRPPVGSFVVVAAFEITRPLQLLDFQALRSLAKVGSKFDPETISNFERQEFLHDLETMITKPVMPDHEHRDYLVTQAMADFLANHPEVRLDGLQFRSAQGTTSSTVATNITLFPKASGVEGSDIQQGPTAEFRLFENDEDGFRIEPHLHWLPPRPPPRRNRLASLYLGEDHARETLRLVRDSIEIRQVKAATYHAPAIKTQHTPAPDPKPGGE